MDRQELQKPNLPDTVIRIGHSTAHIFDAPKIISTAHSQHTTLLHDGAGYPSPIARTTLTAVSHQDTSSLELNGKIDLTESAMAKAGLEKELVKYFKPDSQGNPQNVGGILFEPTELLDVIKVTHANGTQLLLKIDRFGHNITLSNNVEIAEGDKKISVKAPKNTGEEHLKTVIEAFTGLLDVVTRADDYTGALIQDPQKTPYRFGLIQLVQGPPKPFDHNLHGNIL